MAHADDKEQIEMLKRWWNNYGKAISIAVLIGLAVGFGWRYWQNYQTRHSGEASIYYQELQNASIQNNNSAVTALTNRLVTAFKHTPYAAMAKMLDATSQVQQNQLNKAQDDLMWIVNNSHIDSLKQIARIRASRILLAQNKPEDALALLSTVNDPGYQPVIDSVKGDIYTKMKKPKLAQASYQSAKTALASLSISDPSLDMKLAQ